MKRISSVLLLALIPSFANAIDLDESGSLTITGFYNITGAKVLSGAAQGSTEPWTYQQWNCPCTIQNWEYVGVYEKNKGFQFNQETLAGIQIKKEFASNLSFTTQLVSRANNPNYGSRPTVDWAYAAWSPAKDSPWIFQAGRMRIPLYYYSDYLYIGYAFPWVRPAPDVYGWPIFTYDGINATYKQQLGKSDWAMTAHTWLGGFTQKNDAYYTKIYYTTPTNDSWKKILGGYVALNNGIFDVRAMVMKHRESVTQDNPDGSTATLLDNQFTKIVGLSANMDYNNWLIKTEVDRFEQKDLNFIYKYALFGIGYTYGNFTPMYTFSRYRTVLEPIEGRNTQYLSLRWDFMKNNSLKFQYDITKDKSNYPYKFFGDSKLLSVSLQGVF